MARLHIKNGSDHKEPVTDVDKSIMEHIRSSDMENFDDVLKTDKRYEVFYHLTKMRSSLFNWYEFDPEGTLLEIGGEFGALTGLFCDKCRSVCTLEVSAFRAEAIAERYRGRENLDVYEGGLESLSDAVQFDYIVLIGGLEYAAGGAHGWEPYAAYLKRVLSFLKPEGRLLAAVENRYGIRYFCGAEDPHTGKPFYGIQKYPGESDGYSFSKQELIAILERSGVKSHKFYYPLPDYKFPQLVYSQEYLPRESIGERLMPYYSNKEPLVAFEADLYDDLVENHVFEFFSNSFLVECAARGDAEFCSVLYAALSTDRGEKNAFITAVHAGGVVTKRPVHPAGEASAKAILRNMEALERLGLDVVKHEWTNQMLVMPQVESDTLCTALRRQLSEDKAQFIASFEELYQCILKSSEHVAAETHFTGLNPNIDWGPILKTAYIDMIPINCFNSSGKFIFFDQEFTRDSFPAKYVMFRALKYTYQFMPEADEIVPLYDMRRKFGLAGLIWNYFEVEEEEFVSQNRNYDIYSQFIDWWLIDREKIQRKAQSLLEMNDPGVL